MRSIHRIVRSVDCFKVASLILGFCIFITCIRTTTMGLITNKQKEAIQSQVFKAPFYKVFRAALVSLEEASYSIKSAALENGIITTDWKKGIEEPNDAFFLDKFGYENIRRQITVNLTSISEKTTQVRIWGITQFGDDYKGWQGKTDEMPVEVVKKSCQKYFKAIQQKLSLNKIISP